MEQSQLRKIVEGALLAAGQPLSLNRLKALFAEEEAPDNEMLRAALDEIAADCPGRGFELKELGSGWRFQVREELAPWINRLWDEKPPKYSRALLETLALVAYRQPLTRGDIEEVRGVAVSSHIIKTLTEREWIKVVGHRDVPGRPALYATTRQFLDHFNLKSLEELPSLGEIRDLNDINKALDLDEQPDRSDGDESGDDEQADPFREGRDGEFPANEDDQGGEGTTQSGDASQPGDAPGEEAADRDQAPEPENGPGAEPDRESDGPGAHEPDGGDVPPPQSTNSETL